jgi:hypothetical protein
VQAFFRLEKVMAATENDRDILARTLWGEARGESLAGQIAVAWTIRNRVNDGNAKSWWGGRAIPVSARNRTSSAAGTVPTRTTYT